MSSDKTTTFSSLIVDPGTFSIRAGVSGNEEPEEVIRGWTAERYSGKHTYRQANLVSRGMFNGNDSANDVLSYLYTQKLSYASEYDFPLFLLDNSHLKGYRNQRSELLEICFEWLNVPHAHLYLSDQCVCSLVAADKYTGLVLNLGYGTGEILPIYEIEELQHARKSLDTCTELDVIQAIRESDPCLGQDLKIIAKIEQLMSPVLSDEQQDGVNMILHKAVQKASVPSPAGIPTPTAAHADVVDVVGSYDGNKKLHTYYAGVSPYDYKEVMKPIYAKDIVPSIEKVLNFEYVANSIHESISMCDQAIQSHLYSNILLTGTVATLDGFDTRLKYELIKSSKANKTAQTANPSDTGLKEEDIKFVSCRSDLKAYQAFAGASVLSMYMDEESFVSKDEYENDPNGCRLLAQ